MTHTSRWILVVGLDGRSTRGVTRLFFFGAGAAAEEDEEDENAIRGKG